MAVNALQYVKNVGKSFGYSAIDSLKTYNPQIATLASGAKDFSSELKDSIDDMKSKISSTNASNADKNIFGIGKSVASDLRKNLMSDLKTGNWYNKERKAEADEAMVKGMMGFDFDDFDFDFDDFDDEDMFNDSGDTAANAGPAVQVKTAEAIIDSMDMVGSKSANAIAGATVQSADYIASSNREDTKALYSMQQKSFMQLSTGLAAINANIQTFATIAEPLTVHMQNSATFYTQSAEYQRSVLEKLDIIVKNTTIEEKTTSTDRNHTLGEFMTADGFDLFGYLGFIRDNAKSKVKESTSMFDMFGEGGIENFLKTLTASPMQAVTNGLIKSLIPEVTKSAMKEFNEAMSSFLPAALDTLQHTTFKGTFGDIFDSLKDILFPSDRLQDTLNTSKYQHGKVNWTGESEMALKEVIPTYLSAIVSALTGEPMTVYDYGRGMFVKRQNVEKAFNANKQQEANRAGGDFRYEVTRAISNAKDLNGTQKQNLLSQVDTFFLNAFNKGGYSITEFSKGKRGASDFGIDEETAQLLKEALKAFEQNNKRGTNMSLVGDIREGRERYNESMRRAEEENGINRSLFNNSNILLNNGTATGKAGTGVFGVDQYGHDVFFYLQDLWKSNWYLADNIAKFGINNRVGKGSRRGGIVGVRNLNTANEKDRENISNIKSKTPNTPESGEVTTEDLLGAINDLNENIGGERRRTTGEKKLEQANADTLRANEQNNILLGDAAQYQNQEVGKEEERRAKQVSNFNKAKSAVSNRFEALSGGAFTKIKDRVNSIMAVPGQVFADILNAGQASLYNLVFGKEDEEGNRKGGLFAYFYKQADNLFDNFNSFFDSKIKKTMSQWMDWLVNGSLDELRDDVVNNFKSAGRWVGNKVKNFLGFGGSAEAAETGPIENAAFGRKVTKTGLIAVSEGELIIPSEYNPFYHGSNNKANQLRKENDAVNRFYGNYARGGTVKGIPQDFEEVYEYYKDGEMSLAEAAEMEGMKPSSFEKLAKDYENGAGAFKGRAATTITGNDKLQEAIGKVQNSAHGFAKLLEDSVAKLGQGFGSFVNALFPKSGNEEEESHKIFSLHSAKLLKDANLSDEMKKNSGAMITGGAIGTGVSILSGCIVGPLAGAAIGAGVGLVVKSESIQKALFGDIEVDKDGNAIGRSGGIISKEMSNFITKKVPNAALATGAGAVAGMFMGSPILGAILGGTISFAAQSESIQRALFGEKDENGDRMGGMISKELQDKLKKAMPNMGAGAIAGMLLGPFGIPGNIIIGTAVGYASTSEKFQDAILGKVGPDGKREGGIVGEFRGYFFGYKDDEGKQREGIIQSVVGIFDKIGDEIRVRSRNIFKDTAQNLRSAIDRAASSTLGQWLGGTRLGRAAGAVANTARRVVHSPFAFLQRHLENTDVRLGIRSLRQGRNIRNAQGQWMTGEERAQWAQEHGMEGYGETAQGAIDTALSGAQSQEDLNAIADQLAIIENPYAATDKAQKQESTRLAYMLEGAGIDARTATDINHLAVGDTTRRMRRNGVTDINQLLSGVEDENTRNRILEQYNKVQESVAARGDAKAAEDAARAELAQRLGVSESDLTRDTVRDIQDRLKAEGNRRFPNGKAPEEAKPMDQQIKDEITKVKDTVKEGFDATVSAVMFVGGKNPDGSPIVEGAGGEATESGEEVKKSNNPAEEAVNNASSNVVPEENAEEVSEENGESSESPLGSIAAAGAVAGVTGSIWNRIRSFFTGRNKTSEEEPTPTQFDMLGNPIQTKRNEQGEIEIDMQDKETAANVQANNELRESMMSVATITPAIAGLGGSIGKLFSGEGESSGGGFFSNLFDKFFGDKSFLGGLFNMISGIFGGPTTSTLKAGLTGAVSKVLGVVGGAGLIAAVGAAIGGKFDDFFNKITNGGMSNTSSELYTGEDGGLYHAATDENGEILTDEEGNVILENGEIATSTGIATGSDTSFSTQLKKNIATSVVTGQGSVVTSALNKGVKAITGGAGIATVASGAVSTVMKAVTKFLEYIPKIMSHVPLLSRYADKADLIVTELYTFISDKIGGVAAKKLSSFFDAVSSAAPYIRFAFAVAAAANGVGEAEQYFEVKEATTAQKFIAGLVAGINAFIPYIGNLIPNKMLIDFFVSIASKIGLDMSSLEQQQAELQADIAGYNELYGTDLTTEEYLEQVENKGGYVRKVGNWATSFKNTAKEQGIMTALKENTAIGRSSSDLKEKISGLGSTVSEKVSGVKDTVVNGVTTAKNKVVDTATSIRDNIVGGVSGFFNNTKEKITGAAGALRDNVMGKITSIGDIVEEEKAFCDEWLKDVDAPWKSFFEIEDDPDNPMSGIVKVFRMATRIGYSVFVFAKKIFGKISKKVSSIMDTVTTGFNTFQTNQNQLDELAKTGDVTSVLHHTYEGTDDNPLNGVLKVVSSASKVMYVPMSLVHWAGNKISEVMTKAFDAVKTGFENYGTNLDEIKAYALEGDVDSVKDYEWQDAEDNPLNGVFSFVFGASKLGYTAVGTIVHVGKKIAETMSNIIEGVKGGYNNLVTGVEGLSGIAKEGDISELMSTEYERDENDPLSGVFNFAFGVTRLFYVPVAGFHWVSTKVGDFIGSKVDAAKTDWGTLSSTAERMEQLASDGDSSTIFDMTYTRSDDNIIGPLFSAIFYVEKTFYGIVAIVNKVFGKIGDFVGGLFGGVKNIGSNIVSGVTDFVGGVADTVSNAVQTGVENAKEWLNEDEEEEEEEAGAGSRIRGLRSYVGAGSGDNEDFVSQYDSKYKNLKFGNSTVENLGCGPAAATMAVNSTRPGTANMRDSMKLAEGFQSSEGTSADYFQYALGQYGMPANYIDSTTEKGQEALRTELAMGSSAILLGRDNENTDKKFSPFGPNSHYVVATGMDNKGNIIINDPEANRAGIKYNKSILNNVSLGITSEMSPEATDNYRSSVGSGVNVQDTEYSRAVWGYLTGRGFSPAAAAGILGNMYQESGVNPTVIQGNGKGPAAGIVQWENWKNNSARWAQMNKYAQSQGKDWTDLDAQLKFMDAEFTGELKDEVPQADTGTANLVKQKYGSIDAFRSLTDVDEAAKGFEETFERAGKPAMENRYAAAEQYYAMYDGSPYTGTYSAVSSGTTGATSDSSSSGGLMGILQTITSAFSSAFAKIIGGSDSSTTTSSSTGYSSDSGLMSLNGPGGEGNAQQQELVNVLKPYVGKLEYSMNGARNPEKGSADCSSTVNWAYKKVVGESIGDDTPSILNSSKTSFVDVPSQGISKTNPGSTSSGPNLSNLEPGDLMLYTRYNSPSGFANGRPYAVGHVEMYTGNGQKMGHGETPGPTVKAYTQDSERYIGAKRYNPFIEAEKNGTANNTTTSSSSSARVNKAESNAAGGASGINAKQEALSSVLNPYVGQLEYSQKGPRNPEKGSADCSSTVNWAYKKIVGDTVGDNTEAMLNSTKTSFIDIPNPGISIVNPGSTSAGPNINNLQPGDLMLYTRYANDFAQGRPYDVGHVEMYIGNGQKIGHGSTPGPKIKSYDQDASNYIGAKRYNSFISSSTTTLDNALAQRAKNEEQKNFNNAVASRAGAGSGLNGVTMPTVTKLSMPSTEYRNGRRYRKYSGGASDTEEDTTRRRARTSDNDNLIVSLLKTIAKAAQAIAENTTDIPTLGNTLTNYCKSKLSTEVTEAKSEVANAVNNNESSKVNPEDDPALQDLMYTMGEIAKG